MIVGLGATVPAAGVSARRVLAEEAIVTFVLVPVVVAVSGGGGNPARAIGPMILAGQFSDWWAYLEAPMLPQ